MLVRRELAAQARRPARALGRRAPSACTPWSATSSRRGSASPRRTSSACPGASTTSSIWPRSTTWRPTPTACARRTWTARATRSSSAEALDAGCLHHVSSIAAAGRYRGTFRENMFEEADGLDDPYFATKHESEGLVRATSARPWRIYRPGIVVGHSADGRDRQDRRPLLLLRLLRRLRTLPSLAAAARHRGRRRCRSCRWTSWRARST